MGTIRSLVRRDGIEMVLAMKPKKEKPILKKHICGRKIACQVDQEEAATQIRPTLKLLDSFLEVPHLVSWVDFDEHGVNW